MSDRASIVAIAVLQIVAEPELSADELQLRVVDILRDEFADIARQIAAEREECW